jgi:ankyrin repeat protein
LIANGETQAVMEMIRKMRISEIVGIRGLSLLVDDIEHEEDTIDTVMWNPLHYAIYYQNFELVKYFV